ncbi:hypothetical protein Tsubulata_007111 [Turnera subulata]|uniref:Protein DETOXIFICATION n=1 Tax=Turnera subulata TaxID=218843 RepID=A0A9Q0GJ53_9ROSI|nr:hypothetical protein Tsubulata_007111 [Turnera subulata]
MRQNLRSSDRDMEEEDSKASLDAPLIRIHEDVEGHGAAILTRKCLDKADMITEIQNQMSLAGPLVVVSFLQYSLQMISVMFVGHLGELSLASASMATSFAGVTGFSFMLGMGCALETLCGQAYGAKQYHMLGVHLQRAMLVLTCTSIPISFLWSCTGKIFIFFKQDEQISIYSQKYALCLIPSILPFGLLQCQLRFLQTQNIVLPLVLSTWITSLIHVLTCWTLIFRFEFGIEGAALSSGISYWINVLILAIYIKFSATCQLTWKGFSKEGRENTLHFLKLGIPSALMQSQTRNINDVYQTWTLFTYPHLHKFSDICDFLSWLSVSLTSSTRVSNELGAGRPHAAKLAVQIVIFLAVLEGLSVNLILFALRGVWGYLYTTEGEVVRYLASVMPVLVVSNFMDGMQAVLSGTARGCGWQKICAFINLGAYYLVGLPSAIILTFVFHLGGKGLWAGIICGSALQATILLIITLRTNWEHEVKKARNQIFESNIK